MGCDIHLYLEEKIDGKWKCLDKFTEDSKGFLEVEEWLHDDRDYDFFAVLAGVRNGCDFVPISEPRGLPPDCSHELLRYHDEADYGFHSHSWLGYKEILKYYIDLSYKYVEKDGWVTKKDYDFFKLVGRPSSYFGGGGGESISNEEMEKLDPSVDYKWKYKTLIQWKESYYECVGQRLDRLLEEMVKYSTKKIESDIRIVFWFDN
jgi:hypothetical protein